MDQRLQSVCLKVNWMYHDGFSVKEKVYTVEPLYIADTIGELCVGRYRGLAIGEGFISSI